MHFKVVHEGKREWRCEECRDGFGNGNVLKRHLMIHTEERPWECGICGQRFRHKEVMRRHVRGHEEKGVGFKPNGPKEGNRKRNAHE